MGLELANLSQFYIVDVEYPGHYALLFQKGVAAWWVGHTEECREIMEELQLNYVLNELFANTVQSNIDSLGHSQKFLNLMNT